jgi:hypothetical protein
MKTDEQIEKMSSRVDKAVEAAQKASDSVDRMSERVDRVTANVGGLNRSMGELIETLIAARLWEKFLRRPRRPLPLQSQAGLPARPPCSKLQTPYRRGIGQNSTG